jgi:hypothetical protein
MEYHAAVLMSKGTRTIAAGAFLSLGLLAACSGKAVDPPAGSAAGSRAAQPVASHAVADRPEQAQGTVLETMDAGNYTYVRVKTATSEIWAAASPFKVAVGDQVVVPLDSPMANFHSPSLNRDFDLIYFAAAITRAGEAAPSGPPHPSATEGAQMTERISPAPGGTSIADIWANRASLGGKSVTVRGKVVKFNGAILGVNWLHIQDGSGSAKDGTNDLTITSTGGANVGDVVTVTGPVSLDKDFGAGYAYAVMIEKATVIVK